MSAPKYLQRNTTSGQVQEVIATETGPASEVVVSTTSGGTIDPSLLPASDAATAVAGQNLTAGQFVYIALSGSPAVPSLFPAVWSSGGDEAIGFILASYTSGQTATYYTAGQNTSLSGLTVGSRYYGNSATAGGVTATVPTGAGTIDQFLGYASSTSSISTDIADGIILAS